MGLYARRFSVTKPERATNPYPHPKQPERAGPPAPQTDLLLLRFTIWVLLVRLIWVLLIRLFIVSLCRRPLLMLVIFVPGDTPTDGAENAVVRHVTGNGSRNTAADATDRVRLRVPAEAKPGKR